MSTLGAKRSYLLICAISCLAVAGGLLYSNTLDAPFVFDDLINIVENPYIRMTEISFEQIAQIKNSRSPRPFANFTFALNYYFHQYRLTGYHLINILIHITNALLIFLIAGHTLRLCRMTSGFLPSLAAALLWLVHPLHTQSVTYIIQRMNSLAAMFYLLALLLYIKARIPSSGNPRVPIKKALLFSGVTLAAILGMTSKQIVATLPLTLWTYEWFFFQNLDAVWLKKQLKWIAGIATLFLIFAFTYFGNSPIEKLLNGYDIRSFNLSERLLTQPRVVIYYISLLLFPHPDRLNLDYDFSISHSFFSPPATVLALTAITMLIIGAMMAARKHRLASFAILWFLGNLIVESSIIGLEIIYEHRTYLPSIFPILACVPLFLLNIKSRPAAWGLLLVTICLCGFWTSQRNAAWENAITLWQDCSSKSPRKGRPYNHLGMAYMTIEDTESASNAFKKSLAINPRDGDALNNMGLILQKQGDLPGALGFFQKAVATGMSAPGSPHHLPPCCVDALYNCGKVFADMDQWQKALQCFEKTLKLVPLHSKAHNSIGIIDSKQGKTEQALTRFQRALAIDPYLAEAYNNMGIVYFQQGEADKAVDFFKKSLTVAPDYADARNNLASVRSKMTQYAPTLRMSIQACEMHPDNPDLLYKLGRLYQTIGMVDAAIAQYRKALRISPDHITVLNELGNLYAGLHRDLHAINIFTKLSNLLPEQPTVYYNLACLYARQGDKKNSVANLKLAIENGYANWSKIKTDPDLAKIHDTPYYRQQAINNTAPPI